MLSVEMARTSVGRMTIECSQGLEMRKSKVGTFREVRFFVGKNKPRIDSLCHHRLSLEENTQIAGGSG